MDSDDEPINPWEALKHQPLWFRLRWRFLEWRRQRYLRRLYREIDERHENSTFP